jgi:hypothetical protein
MVALGVLTSKIRSWTEFDAEVIKVGRHQGVRNIV